MTLFPALLLSLAVVILFTVVIATGAELSGSDKRTARVWLGVGVVLWLAGGALIVVDTSSTALLGLLSAW